MEVLPGPLPDGRRSGGDEGLGSRLTEFKLRWWLPGKWHTSLTKFVHFFVIGLKVVRFS